MVHAVPTKHQVGDLWAWLEADNKGLEIAGARWLLNEDRRQGKCHSSLVVYLANEHHWHGATGTPKVHMGKTAHRTTQYEWDRS